MTDHLGEADTAIAWSSDDTEGDPNQSFLYAIQAIAHALIAIATNMAQTSDAARREARRQAFEDAEILAGRWHAVVRDTDLLAEIRARAVDPLAPLSARYVGGHLANAPQPATPAIAERNEPGTDGGEIELATLNVCVSGR